MDRSDSESAPRLILLAEGALVDLSSIDSSTASMWGEDQAERYLGFLHETLAALAHEPNLGAIVAQRPEYRVYTAKFRPRRNAHGHRVFYKEIAGGIEIIRILHTAMHWPLHLPGEEP